MDVEASNIVKARADTPKLGSVPWYLHVLRHFIGLLLFFLTPFMMWRTVEPKEVLLIMCFGKLWKVIDEPGCHVIVPWGCSFHTLSTKHITIDLAKSTIADLNGNPVVVGAIINYQIIDPVAAFFNVEFVHKYIGVNASTVLKSVVSRYPYESTDTRVASLKNSSQAIATELRQNLDSRVSIAGVSIAAFDLSDLYYAPEIAGAMLIRQQAQATIDARHVIVDGAVEIVGGAIEGLVKRGVRVSEPEAARLASNLLCVICSESQVQNTLPMQ